MVWEILRRVPGVDDRSGMRYEHAISPAGKLVLTPVRKLLADGIELRHLPGPGESPIEYTVLPLDRQSRSFQLLQHNARGRKVFDAVFRNEPTAAPPVDPLVPEHLTTIDRTIKKEPKYNKKPKYALLAFGPEAEFRVWVAIDGDTAYIDRNGNGDLTEEGELLRPENTEKNVSRQVSCDLAYCLPGTKRTTANVWWSHDFGHEGRTGGMVGGTTDTYLSQTAGDHGRLNYAPSPELAAVIHFGSEMVTIRPSFSPSTGNPRSRYSALDANRDHPVLFQVGTPGVGAGNKKYGASSFASFDPSSLDYRERRFREAVVNPIAEYEFTPLNPADGVKKVKIELSERFGYSEFGGKITVPQGVKTGLDAAKVTLSYPNCPWGRVEPVTYLVDVIPKK
jgi:hypothetical protein